MEAAQFHRLDDALQRRRVHLLHLAADGADLVAVVLRGHARLIARLLREVVLHHQPQFLEEADGIVERGAAHPEVFLLHFLSQFLQREMPAHAINGLEDGIPLRRFPEMVVFQIICEREPYSLQNVVIHLG